MKLSFSEDTVALYIMQLERQFPSSGHLVDCLDCMFCNCVDGFYLFIILVLCALMICCIFLVYQ